MAASAVAGAAFSFDARAEGPRALIKPPRLKPRALVGLVAPGGVLEERHIELCVRNLEGLGLRVKLGGNVRAAYGGYAGTVAQRVDDLHAMFRDREVAAIWCARGGSGCTALLPHLDYALARRSPKVVVGFSDVTALHLAFLRRAGLITFHGPAGISTFSDYSIANLRAVLMEPEPSRTFEGAAENSARAPLEPAFAPRTYIDGVATGRLVGGNLSVLSALVGTEYAAATGPPHVPLPGGPNLLFLEEVGEAPYRIDRMLTQLRQSGLLASAAGTLLGIFQRCEATDGELSLTLQEVLENHLGAIARPSGYGYSFGHVEHQLTLPVGVRARLDTGSRTLTLLEPAVT